MTPAENVIRQQREEIIKDKIALLGERYSELLELRYYKELSYEEIAEALSIPMGTVKGRIYKAKELLAEQLKGNESIEDWEGDDTKNS